MITLERVIFWVLLFDSIAVNLIAWSSGQHYYRKHLVFLSLHLPMSKGWAIYYLILVLTFGSLLYKNGLI